MHDPRSVHGIVDGFEPEEFLMLNGRLSGIARPLSTNRPMPSQETLATNVAWHPAGSTNRSSLCRFWCDCEARGGLNRSTGQPRPCGHERRSIETFASAQCRTKPHSPGKLHRKRLPFSASENHETGSDCFRFGSDANITGRINMVMSMLVIMPPMTTVANGR